MHSFDFKCIWIAKRSFSIFNWTAINSENKDNSFNVGNDDSNLEIGRKMFLQELSEKRRCFEIDVSLRDS